MARIFTSRNDNELIDMIKNGAVGVVLTDTVYGIVAAANHPQAVTRLYEIKSREQKPGTTIAASVEQLKELGLEASVVDAVAHFWPAPLSIVLPEGDNLQYLHQGVGNSPFRVVADEPTRGFLLRTGPLLTSSANQPAKPPATTIAEAQAYFGEAVDYYVDEGAVGQRQPSTIAALTQNGKLHIYRQGAAIIKAEDQE